jgi:poly-beta-1,6-N-acetyl-D-glucosamine synthase
VTPRYIIITPARDEAENIAYTIGSVVSQTIPPVMWVIVNDGSTDDTATIVEAAAAEHNWIQFVHRVDRGCRKPGGGVIEAIEEGLKIATGQSWEFLVKLDADVAFDPDYFERCLQKFSEEPQLGIGGGLICEKRNGGLVSELSDMPSFHVRGATKIYRRACWDAIGGLIQAPGWDTIDELKANMLGWRTRTFQDVFLHHRRYTGRADGTWKNYVKFGLANYIAGYHPLFMLLKCLRRCPRRPYLLGALGLWWGFCHAYLTGVAQVDDPMLIRYVRREQMKKLICRPSLW